MVNALHGRGGILSFICYTSNKEESYCHISLVLEKCWIFML